MSHCNSIRTALSAAILACGLGILPAHATSPVTEIVAGDVPDGLLGLGMGWRWVNSPYTGLEHVGSVEHDNKSDLMPFYYYQGKYLFAHGSTAGVHLLDTEHFSLDALLAYRFDRLEP